MRRKPPRWTGMALNAAEHRRLLAGAALSAAASGVGLRLIIRGLSAGVLPMRSGGEFRFMDNPIDYVVSIVALGMVTAVSLGLFTVFARMFLRGVYRPDARELEAALAASPPVERRLGL